MVVTTQCPNCNQRYRVREESLGAHARCKKCGQGFTVEMKADDTISPKPGDSQGPPQFLSRIDPADKAQGVPPPVERSPDETNSVPQTIGPYTVRRRLGGGAMGEVWLAWDPALQREVAIKTLRSEVALSAQGLDRFLREARLAARLHHTNAVTVYQVGVEGQTAYIAMEYVEGQSLDKAVSPGKPMQWREATLAIRDAAAGLAAAHRLELIHRDVKPANLMQTSDGTTKVVDFGLARAKAGETQLTQQGTILGTPSYMAPEIWARKGADGRSDLYALACTYYCLLTGEPPFDADNFVALGYQHTHEPLPDPRQRVADLPNAVCRILAKGARKHPDERYQSADEMLEGLDAVLATPQESLVFDFLKDLARPSCSAARKTIARPHAVSVSLPKLARRASQGIRRVPPKWLVLAAFSAVVVVLLGIVLPIQTGHGTVTIELSDPTAQVTVTVDHNIIDIAGLQEPLRLKAGEHDLLVESADYKSVSQSFTLRRGGDVVLRVTLEPKKPIEEGFVSVFDGKTLAGWEGDTQHYFAENGRLVSQFPSDPFRGSGGSLFTEKEYSDFVLRLDYRVALGAASGVLIRAPLGGDSRTGMEVQIIDPAVSVSSLLDSNGSLTGVRAARQGHEKPRDHWNQMEISCRQRQITVNLNGAEILDCNLDDFARWLTRSKKPSTVGELKDSLVATDHPGLTRGTGRIGLSGYSSTGRAEYRNLRIKELASLPTGAMEKQPLTSPAPKTESAATPQPPFKEITVDLGNGVGMQMVLVPAGEFLMGSPDLDENANMDEKPQHLVRITQPFYLGKYEVTQTQWGVVMGSNPSTFRGPENPVEMVSWDDCQGFLRKLNGNAGKAVGEFRLPTEAEWEYACRAGSTTKWAFGNEEPKLGECAWYGTNSGSTTHPVGQKKPNAWGLYDMHGNVWESCADWLADRYYAGSRSDDPSGPDVGSFRVCRGGGWNIDASGCRAAVRCRSRPGHPDDDRGFRLAMTASVPTPDRNSRQPARSE